MGPSSQPHALTSLLCSCPSAPRTSQSVYGCPISLQTFTSQSVWLPPQPPELPSLHGTVSAARSASTGGVRASHGQGSLSRAALDPGRASPLTCTANLPWLYNRSLDEAGRPRLATTCGAGWSAGDGLTGQPCTALHVHEGGPDRRGRRIICSVNHGPKRRRRRHTVHQYVKPGFHLLFGHKKRLMNRYWSDFPASS